MTRGIRWMLFPVLLAGSAPAQETLPDAALKGLKAATVFIQTSRSSGSGFIIRRDGRTALVITCAHVVQSAGQDPVTGVWNAGAAGEAAVPLKLIGIDLSADIAVLRCEIKDPPAPIPPAPPSRLRETLPVFVAGYPFGAGMATSSRYPAPTITKASVAALKTDEFGALRIVQLDGELNPGNSGGPVVDARGSLIGMAAMKISDSKISFAVASTDITDLMEGRAFPPVLVGRSGDGKAVTVRVFAGIVDPLKRVRNPVLLLIPRIKLAEPPKPGDKGVWGPISDAAEEFPLKVTDGVIDQDITVRKGESDDGRFVAQLRYSRDGASRWSAPVDAQFDFEPKSAPAKDPDPPRPAEPPAAGKEPELDFEVRLDETGRDAVLAYGGPDGNPVKFRQYQWKDRDAGGTPIFSEDLKTAYVVSLITERRSQVDSTVIKEQTLIRKINLETLREERSLTLGRGFRLAQWAPAGLVLTCQRMGHDSDAVVLDPASLQVVGHLTKFGYFLMTHRSSPIAVTYDREWITFFDLKKNAVVNRLSLPQIMARKEKPKIAPKGRAAQHFKSLAWTADGRFLIGGDSLVLHRFRFKGDDLAYEEAGPVVSHEISFLLSPDSRAVLVLAVPREVEKYMEKGQEKEKVKTYIDERWLYKIENLAVPSARLRPFNAAYPFSFDPSGKVLFARGGVRNTGASKIFKLSLDGRMLGEYEDVPMFGYQQVLSPTRIVSFDTGLRIWDFPQ